MRLVPYVELVVTLKDSRRIYVTRMEKWRGKRVIVGR